MNKSHLFFRNPVDGVVSYKPRPRAVFGKEEEDDEYKNYSPMKREFQNSLSGFNIAKEQRDNQRNTQLNIPLVIDFVQIEFFSHFKIDPFANIYRNEFGLAPVQFDNFNYVGFFAIDDITKFQNFIDNVVRFISSPDDPNLPSEMNKNILFIRNFKFFTSSDRKNYEQYKERYNINLIDSSVDIYESKIKLIEDSLTEYLEDKGINYNINNDSNKLEVINISIENINEIIDNFDIVMSVNSPTSGVVRPSPFNLEIRNYGFEISNTYDDLPIVGIIDTGVSAITPLAPLIINDGMEFDLTNTDPRIDNFGHGTAVAAIASLGKPFYQNNSGAVEAYAKILSIKALDAGVGFISENEIRKSIIDANNKYGVKIFILCLGYVEAKPDNYSISNYAYSLDLLANDLDILIFISAGNADQYYLNADGILINYPKQFNSSRYNINVPADSMNNLSCGAISSNIENNSSNRYNIYDPTYPASYTRKFYINRKNVKAALLSKHLTKPDLCDCGGDIDLNVGCSETGLKVLSPNPGIFFERTCGTSFSTPFIANQALRLIKTYPQLNIQTIKALILNSCVIPNTGELFDNLSEVSPSDLLGKGIPELEESLYSDENRITLVLEDNIRPEFIKSYPIKLPEYLLNLDKQISLLEINATLCYKFKPILYNHLAYCPFHISFGIFRYIDLEFEEEDESGRRVRNGLNGGLSSGYVFKESWSEDYYFKAKMLSNCHKVRFVISKKDLINDNCKFKIGIRSKFHGFINLLDKEENDILHPFSLIITIKENKVKNILSNRLYDEMIAINELEAVAEIEAEVELES